MNGEVPSYACLSALPVELAGRITSFLPNRDIKSLRLTCSSVHNRVTLRLERVFISANPLNIQVVEQVANHEQFRRGVTEIIWDETYLEDAHPMSRHSSQSPENRLSCNSICPEWYKEYGNDSIEELCKSMGDDDTTNRPDQVARMRQLAAAMSPDESYAYYYKLVEQESWMLRISADFQVFKYALQRFPSLRRVTISSTTHGRLFMPRYETPMIRSFPYGFVYPPTGPVMATKQLNFYWGSSHLETERRRSMSKRVLSGTLKALAEYGKHSVSEFIFEGAGYCSDRDKGFDGMPQTLASLHSLIQRPSFRRLDLPSSYLIPMHETLEKAKTLQSLCFSDRIGDGGLYLGPQWAPTLQPEQATYGQNSRNGIFRLPSCLAENLQNLVLQGTRVPTASLVRAVTSLASLRSLQLCGVSFGNKTEHQGVLYKWFTHNPRHFLFLLREDADWRSRPLRPRVTTILYQRYLAAYQMVKIDSEINEFLYENGECPFVPARVRVRYNQARSIEQGDLHHMCRSKGTKMDEFDPADERPYDYDEETVKELGFIAMKNRPWGDGPWGRRTIPTLREQGLDEPIPSGRD